MWARMIEVALACWLALSPCIFAYPGQATWRWVNDNACAFVILIFAFSSFHHRLRRAHLVNMAVAMWLIGLGYFAASPPPPPWLQNEFTIGLLLGMFAIIPSDASHPPERWPAFLERTDSPST